jgi:hypothetical protein
MISWQVVRGCWSEVSWQVVRGCWSEVSWQVVSAVRTSKHSVQNTRGGGGGGVSFEQQRLVGQGFLNSVESTAKPVERGFPTRLGTYLFMRATGLLQHGVHDIAIVQLQLTKHERAMGMSASVTARKRQGEREREKRQSTIEHTNKEKKERKHTHTHTHQSSKKR